MTLSLIYGTIVGLLLGLAWCYWKQIRAVQENKDLLTSGSDLFNSAQTFVGQVRQKL